VSEPAPLSTPPGESLPDVSFLCCVEAGKLEPQAVLLARSIRTFGGSLAQAPIYAVAPRAGQAPGDTTRRAFAELGVTLVAEPLNVDFPDYGMANKWAAGRWAEEQATTDVVAFVDSDTIFTADPAAFRLAPGIDIAVRPADKKDKGSTGPGDEREPYWQRLYALTGVSERPWVESPVDRQRIRAYFNGGLVVTRRSERIFSAWYDDFLVLHRANHLPPEGIGFMDMLSLAATVARRWERTAVLDWHYNYPLPLRPALPEPARSVALEELVHVHYHRWFARPGFLDEVIPPIAAGAPVRAFVEPWLPFEPTITGLPKEYKAARGTATGKPGKAATQGAAVKGSGVKGSGGDPSGLRGLLRRVTGR
jgi:hypothetical protein